MSTHSCSKVPVGDLMVGEMSRFHRGVCMVIAIKDGEEVTGGLREKPDHIVVRGENGHQIERIPLDPEGVNKDSVEWRIATAIRRETESL